MCPLWIWGGAAVVAQLPSFQCISLVMILLSACGPEEKMEELVHFHPCSFLVSRYQSWDYRDNQ